MSENVVTFPTQAQARRDALVAMLEELLEDARSGKVADLVAVSMSEAEGMQLCMPADTEDDADHLMRYSGVLSTGSRWAAGLATGEMEFEGD